MYNSVKYFISRFRTVFLSIVLLVLLASCMDDSDDYVSEPVEVAYVNIYHAGPDAPDMDIVVDGRVINTYPFGYTTSSGYLNFFTGDRSMQFRAQNAANALIDTTFNLVDGRAYSLFAINRLADIEALLVVDSAAAPASGKAMVRFVHLSPDAPALSVSAQGVDLFNEVSFREAAAFREIDAKTYTFQLTAADGADVALSTGNVEVKPGQYYTLIVRGFATPPAGNSNVLSVEVLD